jgi:hypothetical protein
MLSIVVCRPLVQGGQYIDTYTDEFNAYRHSIRATGGYWDASFSIRNNLTKMEEWFEDGIGRHIVVQGPDLQTVWEGFVDKVTITYGPISIVKGPLTNVANIVSLNYGSKSAGATWKYNLPSVVQWGYFQKALSASNINVTQAQQLRDQYLIENCLPETKQDLGSANQETNIVVDCLGYVNYLDKNYYEVPNGSSADELAVQIGITEKIKLALAIERNDVIAYRQLLTNPGFQTAGSGSPDTIASWDEHAGSGSVVQSAIGRPGSPDALNPYSLKLTTVHEATNRDTYASQALTVPANQSYVMSVWHKGSSSGTAYSAKRHGSSALRWGSIFGHAEAEWVKCATPFYVPVGVTAVDAFLYGPSNVGINYFDDVKVLDYPHVVENTYQVTMLEKSLKTCWEVIKDLLAYGDSSNNRYLFGLYAGRIPYYQPAPSTFEYQYRTLDNKHEFTTTTGDVVNNWDVLPGKWVQFTDVLVGKSALPANLSLKTDPRAMFIEEVRYSADEGLTVNAGKISYLQQSLYKLGIMSIGS